MTANRPAVLVIYKRTTYQRYRAGRNKRIQELLARKDPSVGKMVKAHEAHLDTLSKARKALRKLGARATFKHGHVAKKDEAWDLVVTLGGDGTLLWASHLVGADTPMVAINSAPMSSVGYFCAGDRDNVEEMLAAALDGALRASRLTRMQVEIDSEVVHTRVLNDVLFCHECPAATTRYLIQRGDVQESQMSSGIWAGPAAGSTAALRSAGGRVLPIRSQKLQYVVREPYRRDDVRYAHEKGVLSPDESLTVVSKMREGQLYFDGANRVLSVDIGAVVRFSRSKEPLTLLGLRRSRRPRTDDG